MSLKSVDTELTAKGDSDAATDSKKRKLDGAVTQHMAEKFARLEHSLTSTNDNLSEESKTVGDRVGFRCEILNSEVKKFLLGGIIEDDIKNDRVRIRYDNGGIEWKNAKDIVLLGKAEKHETKNICETTGTSQSQSKFVGQTSLDPVTNTIKSEASPSDTESFLRYLQGNLAASIGWKVELNGPVEASEDRKDDAMTLPKLYQIVGFDDRKVTFLVARMNAATVDMFWLGNKHCITKFVQRAKIPLLVQRLCKGDLSTLAKLIEAGADVRHICGYNIKDKEGQVERSIIDLALKKTPLIAKSDILKFLLSKKEIPCDYQSCILAIQRCIEFFKDHILMGKIIDRLHDLAADKSYLSEQERNELYGHCVDHILKLNANVERMDKVDMQVFSLLVDKDIGFSLSMKMQGHEHGVGQLGRGANDHSRPKAVSFATPMIHAIARGNIPMAILLMDREVEAQEKNHDGKRPPEKSGKLATSLSRHHWDVTLNEHWTAEASKWGLKGSPLRLVLFFFIAMKTFSDANALGSLIEKLLALGEIDLNGKEKSNSDSKTFQPILLFLCTLNERKLQIRIREAIFQLLAAGADPEFADDNGLTPLLACIQLRAPRFISILVKAGAGKNRLPEYLLEACKLGHQEEAEALMGCGACFPKVLFPGGYPNFHFNLFSGTKGVVLLKRILENISRDSDQKKLMGWLLLEICGGSSCPNEALVEVLLENGVNFTQCDENGRNSIDLCVINAHASLLRKILIHSKANTGTLIDSFTTESLLVLACNKGDIATVRQLLEHRGKRDSPKKNSPAEIYALGEGALGSGNGAKGSQNRNLPSFSQSERSCSLIERSLRKKLYLGVKGDARISPIIAACKGASPEILRALLKSDAGDVNYVTPEGWTALHLCSALGTTHMVNLLLDHGADANVTDSCKRTPLFWASVADRPDVIGLLAKHTDVNHHDLDNATSLQMAIRYGNYRSAAKLVQEGAVLRGVHKRGKKTD